VAQEERRVEREKGRREEDEKIRKTCHSEELFGRIRTCVQGEREGDLSSTQKTSETMVPEGARGRSSGRRDIACAGGGEPEQRGNSLIDSAD